MPTSHARLIQCAKPVQLSEYKQCETVSHNSVLYSFIFGYRKWSGTMAVQPLVTTGWMLIDDNRNL